MNEQHAKDDSMKHVTLNREDLENVMAVAWASADVSSEDSEIGNAWWEVGEAISNVLQVLDDEEGEIE